MTKIWVQVRTFYLDPSLPDCRAKLSRPSAMVWRFEILERTIFHQICIHRAYPCTEHSYLRKPLFLVHLASSQSGVLIKTEIRFFGPQDVTGSKKYQFLTIETCPATFNCLNFSFCPACTMESARQLITIPEFAFLWLHRTKLSSRMPTYCSVRTCSCRHG